MNDIFQVAETRCQETLDLLRFRHAVLSDYVQENAERPGLAPPPSAPAPPPSGPAPPSSSPPSPPPSPRPPLPLPLPLSLPLPPHQAECNIYENINQVMNQSAPSDAAVKESTPKTPSWNSASGQSKSVDNCVLLRVKR